MLTRRLALGALAAAPTPLLAAPALVTPPVLDLPAARKTPPFHFVYNGVEAAHPSAANPRWMRIAGLLSAPKADPNSHHVTISDAVPQPGNFRHGDTHFERRTKMINVLTFEWEDRITYSEHRYVGEIQMWHAFDTMAGNLMKDRPEEVRGPYNWTVAQFGEQPVDYRWRDEFLPQRRWRTCNNRFLFRDREDAVVFAQRWIA